jgi:hypothetical protein
MQIDRWTGRGTSRWPAGPNSRLYRSIFPAGLLFVLLAGSHAFASDRDGAAAARLSGTWSLDAAASDDPQGKLREAIATRKEPRRPRRDTQLDEVFVPDEPRDPRHETQVWESELAAPPVLTIAIQGSEFRVNSGERDTRVFAPGQPYARVDTRGTAKISSTWKGSSFEVRERYQRYDRGGSRTEMYSLDRTDRLVFTRIVQMPMFGTVTIHSVYGRKP